MKYATFNLLRVVCLLPLAALYLGNAAAQTPTSPSADQSVGMPQEHKERGAAGSNDMKQSMMTGMDSMQKMSMSGDTDKDFAMMMKMHHKQAIDMAQIELAHGKSPAMTAIAKKIIAAQKKEIAEFERWLAKQK